MRLHLGLRRPKTRPCAITPTISPNPSTVTAAQVIKLSDAIQPLPRAVTRYVHGVAKPFLATGERLAARRGQSLSMTVNGELESQPKGASGASRWPSLNAALSCEGCALAQVKRMGLP